MSKKEVATKFELIWRNKWLTSSAKSITEMADKLEAAAKQLREMDVAGVTLTNDDISDDYACLATYSQSVAKRFGFEETDCDEVDA